MLKMDTPSKINVFLYVKGKLPNGYHEIQTIFIPVNGLFDTISLSDSEDNNITLYSNDKSLPLDSRNLCYKTALRYSQAANVEPHWEINIEKRIPIAAGMGGGSSDAAAVLLLLQKKYNLLTDSQLKDLAIHLGADVSFFLNPTSSIATGIGEKLTPLTLAKDLHIVVLAPHFPISAVWAYKNFSRPENQKIPDVNNIINSMKNRDWEKLASMIYNDLAFAAYDKFPLLKILKKNLLDAGALNADITGSGPTIYGICKNRSHATEIAKRINIKYKNMITCLTATC